MDRSEDAADMTTLLEIVRKLGSLDDELTIYARKPWTLESDAILEIEQHEGGLPLRARDGGFAYFLEVFIAQDLLGDRSRTKLAPPTDEEVCALLIHYATHDA